MKTGIKRFGMSLDGLLLKSFDSLIVKKGYSNRSEAIRDLIRGNLVQSEWEAGNKECIGTVTIVYSHHKSELLDVLTDIQHNFHTSVISSMHVHMDEHNCLEVIVVRGKGNDIKKIADRLISAKGVKHGKLTVTTTGKELV